jgi:hypothetical protein
MTTSYLPTSVAKFLGVQVLNRLPVSFARFFPDDVVFQGTIDLAHRIRAYQVEADLIDY